MDKKDNELLERLRAAFRLEAEERLHSMAARLIDLEKSPSPEACLEITETVFREAHSLKGAARSAGMGEIEKFFQSLESVFAALKRRKIAFTPGNFDFLHQAVDTITEFLAQNEEADGKEIGIRIAGLKKQMDMLAGDNLSTHHESPLSADLPVHRNVTPEGDFPEIKTETEVVSSEPADHPLPEPRSEMDRPAPAGIVRISVDKLDALMHQAQEMLLLKQIATQSGQDYLELLSRVEQMMKEWTRIGPETRALGRALDKNDVPVFSGKTGWQYVLNLSNAFDSARNQMRLLEDKLQGLVKASEQNRRVTHVMVDTIVQDMKNVLMLPFSFFLEGVPKMVRDLSRDQGKDIRLIMEGGDVEIDRRILEEMRDPLIHILRNSVDHGIEKPEARILQGKSASGIITVSIKQVNGSKVEIMVADDGAGVDLDLVKKTAVKRGLISEEKAQAMDAEAAISLMFVSEISTSPIITDISGRGLGLAIVREKVEKLGGKYFAKSQQGRGSALRIIIPITLATFRGLLHRVGEHWFIVPTVHVEQVVRIKAEDVRTVENRETVIFNGRILSFVRLADVLELSRTENDRDTGTFITAMILSAAGKQLAFGVDEIINEEEVLLKPLGRQLPRVRNIDGAAVLGSGRVVVVLNVADLIQSAIMAPSRPAQVQSPASAGEKISILVAEDSITSRMLLKNILESAGYRVKTVTDGLEALTELKQSRYDLLVSDVDMPRMNGFVLTAAIRAEKKLAELPVVLVTALQSREDRERGIDAGANAYIVKSSFDQSNLLEVIKKFI